MTSQLLIAHSSNPNLCLSLSLSSDFKPNTKRPNNIPARDIVIDFGKHKGKLLGTLPSNYLKWVSKTLRARDFEHWAKLADQVLQDPVYRDRIEWEFAENVLHGNNARVTTNDSSSLSGNESGGAVSMLLEISERFGWDKEDKAGWSKVNFELLGTSKGGRIPRVAETKRNGSKEEVKVVKGVTTDGALGEKKRREKRERVRLKRREEENKLENKQESLDSLMRQGVDKNQTVETYNPFPGREALLNKVLNNRRRFL